MRTSSQHPNFLYIFFARPDVQHLCAQAPRVLEDVPTSACGGTNPAGSRSSSCIAV